MNSEPHFVQRYLFPTSLAMFLCLLLFGDELSGECCKTNYRQIRQSCQKNERLARLPWPGLPLLDRAHMLRVMGITVRAQAASEAGTRVEGFFGHGFQEGHQLPMGLGQF